MSAHPRFETRYIGPVLERVQRASGEVVWERLYAYRLNGELRYALTESAARKAVAS